MSEIQNGDSVLSRLSKIDHYDFELPQELIAQHPVMNREDARLMTVDRESDSIDHFHIRDMPQLIREGDCLVLNDTRVIPAQLVGYRVKPAAAGTGCFSSQMKAAAGEF